MSPKGTKTLAQADTVLRREVKAILRLKKRAASHGKRFITDIAEIGKRLARVKNRVGHGNWLPWLRQNFDWSGDTAENYINVYRVSQSPKFRSLRNLPLEVLYLLGRRTVSEAARDAIAEQVEAGKKVTIPVVKERVRIISHYRPVARPPTGEAVHTIAPPILQEAVPSDVRFVSPECAPPNCEQTRMISNRICHVADMITDWFAAGDVTDSVDDLSEAERETLIKAFGKIKQFVEVRTQAQFTREHSSVN